MYVQGIKNGNTFDSLNSNSINNLLQAQQRSSELLKIKNLFLEL